MEQGMVVGHCQLLQSTAWEVSSYMCFPPVFLKKKKKIKSQGEALQMSQQASMLSVH